ncbi:MAG: hypothetical protein QME96_06060 [Myxococcota bacterium]|nr:hypothetical protein [Myxococcota bacterium]
MDRLEQAYNPNDCPEVRWGAGRNTPESSTCTHRLPPAQNERMWRHRFWHSRRQRPSPTP